MDENRSEVVMWRVDSIGVVVRLWTKDQRGRIISSSELLIEREALDEWLSTWHAQRAVESQATLF